MTVYRPRTYRNWIKHQDLITFNVVEKETDLFIRATSDLSSKSQRLIHKYREILEKYINRNPIFLTSLDPIEIDENAPQIARAMAEAAVKAGVGPMAAVAGAIADFVGNELLQFSREIIIENGGDIFLKSEKDRVIGLYAGSSPLTGRIGLDIEAREDPIGICTSSGTVGHSLSFGNADAAVILAPTATLADAAATAVCNRVKKPEDIPSAIEFVQKIPDLTGAVIILGDQIGLWGKVKICSISNHDSEKT